MLDSRRRSPYLLIPGALFLVIDLLLVAGMLLRPSFMAIRVAYGFNTVVAPTLFLAAAIAGFMAAQRTSTAVGAGAMTT
jgi:hypothetical protein